MRQNSIEKLNFIFEIILENYFLFSQNETNAKEAQKSQDAHKRGIKTKKCLI